MRTWEVGGALLSSVLFAWGGLIAQATPSTGGGPNVEAWIGTGGSLGILGSLLYYLITKHNPRQEERMDKLVSENQKALSDTQKQHTEVLDKAYATFRAEVAELRTHNDRNIGKLCDTVDKLTDSCNLKPKQ